VPECFCFGSYFSDSSTPSIIPHWYQSDKTRPCGFSRVQAKQKGFTPMDGME